MGKEFDWSKVSKGDILPEIPCGDAPFPAGGVAEKVERGISQDGAIDDFWIRYPKGLYRFTIISREIFSIQIVEE